MTRRTASASLHFDLSLSLSLSLLREMAIVTRVRSQSAPPSVVKRWSGTKTRKAVTTKKDRDRPTATNRHVSLDRRAIADFSLFVRPLVLSFNFKILSWLQLPTPASEGSAGRGPRRSLLPSSFFPPFLVSSPFSCLTFHALKSEQLTIRSTVHARGGVHDALAGALAHPRPTRHARKWGKFAKAESDRSQETIATWAIGT